MRVAHLFLGALVLASASARAQREPAIAIVVVDDPIDHRALHVTLRDPLRGVSHHECPNDECTLGTWARGGSFFVRVERLPERTLAGRFDLHFDVPDDAIEARIEINPLERNTGPIEARVTIVRTDPGLVMRRDGDHAVIMNRTPRTFRVTTEDGVALGLVAAERPWRVLDRTRVVFGCADGRRDRDLAPRDELRVALPSLRPGRVDPAAALRVVAEMTEASLQTEGRVRTLWAATLPVSAQDLARP